MRLSLTHPLPASVDEVWQLLFSDAFSVALDERTGIRREVVSETTKDGKKHITQRIVHAEPLPGVAAKAMGSNTLVYFQDQVVDPITKIVHWRVRLPKMGKKVEASGTYQIQSVSGLSQRVIDGDVSVKVPFIGGKIEREIIRKLSESYDASAQFICQWLEGKA